MVVVVIAVPIDALLPNFKEALELNTKLPAPETVFPAKLIVPFTVIVLPEFTLQEALEITSR